MADIHFKLETVHRHAGAQAERMAVIKPLVPKLNVGIDAQVEAGVFRVLSYWRRRCTDLRKAGWEPATTARFQYMRNCPPAVVSMRPQNREGYTRPCTVATCPWCWARGMVKRTWEVVYPAMAALGSVYVRGGPDTYPNKLVFMKSSDTVEDAPLFPYALLDQISRELDRTKRRLAKDAVGLAMIGYVAPTKTGWRVGQRVLALVPWDLPTDKPGLKVFLHPTRRAVANAVARFARFPAGFMYGNPDHLRRLLEARSSHRLLRFSGAFFSRTQTPQPAEPDGEGRYLDL